MHRHTQAQRAVDRRRHPITGSSELLLLPVLKELNHRQALAFFHPGGSLHTQVHTRSESLPTGLLLAPSHQPEVAVGALTFHPPHTSPLPPHQALRHHHPRCCLICGTKFSHPSVPDSHLLTSRIISVRPCPAPPPHPPAGGNAAGAALKMPASLLPSSSSLLSCC